MIEQRFDEGALGVVALELRYDRRAAFNDHLESLRGRLASGTLVEALQLFPRVIILARQAMKEADRNLRRISLYSNDEQRADALASLRAEQHAVKEYMALIADELRRQEVSFRITYESVMCGPMVIEAEKVM